MRNGNGCGNRKLSSTQNSRATWIILIFQFLALKGRKLEAGARTLSTERRWPRLGIEAPVASLQLWGTLKPKEIQMPEYLLLWSTLSFDSFGNGRETSGVKA